MRTISRRQFLKYGGGGLAAVVVVGSQMPWVIKDPVFSINPGQIVTGAFVASKPGCCLYYDNLNAPVNRVMGLHGAMMVMPKSINKRPPVITGGLLS